VKKHILEATKREKIRGLESFNEIKVILLSPIFVVETAVIKVKLIHFV
jgi:hypothetical protein